MPMTGAELMVRAGGAAHAAFDAGPWLPLEDRVAVLCRLDEGLRRRGEELARLITDQLSRP